MAYVTEDKRVQMIIDRMHAHEITREKAGQQIKSLPKQENARIGYLNWEVDEALKVLG